MPPDTHPEKGQSIVGGLYSFLAFLIWGLSPLYWKALYAVSAFEIIFHRIIWSFVVLIPLALFFGPGSELKKTIKSPRHVSVLLLTSILVGANWLIYIWAVNNGKVLQASLGYYINPLINVLLGVVFLKERLRVAQAIAVLLALTGVAVLTLQQGEIPWISLSLALSFGFYGLIRKVIAVGSLTGLTIETFLLTIPALVWVLITHVNQTAAFLNTGIKTDLLLAGTGILTATPLLLFNLGAKRITLSSLGFIQYTAPTGMLILGIVVFNEPFTRTQAVTFGLIWLALAIYSTDAVFAYKNKEPSLDKG